MSIRTDLALEAAERVSAEKASLPGLAQEIRSRRGFTVTEVTISSDEAAREMDKPRGTYITLALDKLLRREEEGFPDCCHALSEELRALLPLKRGEAVLLVGLGNAAVTPDAVGHEVLKSALVTRHMAEALRCFRPVAALEPGVLGTTGIESTALIRAAVELIHPAAVLAVDALAARDTARLLRTVQLASSGIAPGSGIGNHRSPLSADTLGVPVIGIGVPTVVDAATLASDTVARAGITVDDDTLRRRTDTLIVTPTNIDAEVREIGRVIACAINLALHEGITLEEMELLM